MKIVSWNVNSRSKDETLQDQCAFLSSLDCDVICLQEITTKSQVFFKEFFQDRHIISSFDLSKDLDLLTRKRKYGEIIVSNYPFTPLDPYRINIPFPERVLSVKLLDGYKDLEIYTTHVPPGSSNGVIKVEHFEGLFEYLQSNQAQKILTGDFNSPKAELETGEVITWGQKINASGVVRMAVNPKWKDDCSAERWDSAERNIIQNHTQLGMHDAFRSLNDYQDQSGSWFINRKNLQLGRRYDHVFCSNEIKPIHCYYDHKPRENKLSDHSPVIAELSL